MFSFDITLIVQFIHFGIAWWVVDNFLFKYLVAEYEAERFLVLKKEEEVNIHQRQIKELENKNSAQWQVFKEISKDKMPSIDAPVITQERVVEYREIACFDSLEKERLVKMIAQQLSERVIHD